MLTIRRPAGEDPDFSRCLAIRVEVFVREQAVPEEEEKDGMDGVALHFLALDEGVALGTARAMVKPGGEVKISRVAVLKAARGQGVGAALIRAIEEELPLAPAFILNAQMTALHFYERLGYLAQGDVFMEGGMAHRHMVKRRA